MSTNNLSVTNTASYVTSASKAATTKKETAVSDKKSQTTEDTAAVYESTSDTKSLDSAKQLYKKDTETIQRLLSDLSQRQQQLKDLVEKTLLSQGNTKQASGDIFDALKSGNLKFSAEDIAKAKEDVAEDGYWGVKQTSDRLYSFAYALAGGDPSKADSMLEAIEKGFKQATKAWGSDLPSICKDTLEATREKVNAWKNGTATTEA